MSAKRLIAVMITVPVMTVAAFSGVSQAVGTSGPGAGAGGWVSGQAATPTTNHVQNSATVEALPAFVPALSTNDAATQAPQIWKKIVKAVGAATVEAAAAGAGGAVGAALVTAYVASANPVTPEDAGINLGDAEFDAAG